MVSETSDIGKMDQSVEPPKISSAAALGNKLEGVHSLKDQTTAPEVRIGNTGKKYAVYFRTSTFHLPLFNLKFPVKSKDHTAAFFFLIFEKNTAFCLPLYV